jgi:thioredoxin 1
MEISQEQLKQKIKNGDKIIVDFWAKFCGPCKVMKPTFDKISKELQENNSKVQLFTMDIENNMDYIQELGIRGVPTIKGFSNGNEVFSEVGLKQSDTILEMVNKLN